MRAIFLFIASSFSVLLICCTKIADHKLSHRAPKTRMDVLGAYIITTYGASTDSSDNTLAVQKTIDTCAAAGGSTVVVPAGTFLCGPVSMKSNINLQLDSGAVLKALPYGTYPGSGTSSVKSFIDCRGISNFTITGSGTIEGQGADWWTAFRNNNSIARPAMIRLTSSMNANISGITIQNAPNAHIVVGKLCDTVNITGITISSPSNSPNTDGIDTWSPDINITNCNISCGDDNVAMDSYSAYINIKGCTFGTGHGCSIGSYAADVHDITVDSCTFNGTSTGIRIKSNRGRGGPVKHISYSNITMTNVTNAISLVCYYPKTPSSPTDDSAQDITSSTPDYENITLTNVTATGSKNAGTIWGLPELSISNIVFDNVQISASTGMKAYFVSNAVFINGSQITVSSGDAITAYNADISGIDLVTGTPQ